MNGVTIGTIPNIIAVVQVTILPAPAVALAVCIVAVVGAKMPGIAARLIVTATTHTFATATWGSACASPSNNFHFMSRSAHYL